MAMTMTGDFHLDLICVPFFFFDCKLRKCRFVCHMRGKDEGLPLNTLKHFAQTLFIYPLILQRIARIVILL